LLAKEFREIAGGRALWIMLLLLCGLVGFSFLQAAELYGEASASAKDSPLLAGSLSPLDGILVPTLGSFYLGVTLLFPFVAIRAISNEKETGALRLLVQLPYSVWVLSAAKLTAVFLAWVVAGVPAFSALAVWMISGGHIHGGEALNLLSGHLLYGMLIGAIALFAAAISESSATAAIIALAVTIGSWVLDFTAAGHSGMIGWLSQVSLTQTLRPFEQGLLSAGLVVGMAGAILGFTALAAIWLPPGIPTREKLLHSAVCVLGICAVLGVGASIRRTFDVTEDRRNSFAAADQQQLSKLSRPLAVTVNLAPEDPRFLDLRRNVLSKIERAMPNVIVNVVGRTNTAEADRYGEVDYSYDGRTDMSRSTSPREILPLIYGLAGLPPPAPLAALDYPGYPLVMDARWSMPWFFGLLPLAIVIFWWLSRRPPKIIYVTQGEQS